MDYKRIKEIIDGHEQKSVYSCIPSAIEMILKLEGKVGTDYYELQDAWNDNRDGNFSDFHKEEIEGLKFMKEFGFDRNDNFPIDMLFERIDSLLSEGLFVAISLENGNNWHNFIIYKINESNDYDAITKNGDTTEINNVKQIVKKMKGTDILVYETVAM